jgi:hypothetical protein
LQHEQLADGRKVRFGAPVRPLCAWRALGIELPPAPPAVGDYTPTVIAGNLLFMSGQLPWIAGDLKLDELMPPAAEPECDGATIHPLAPRSGWRAGGRR